MKKFLCLYLSTIICISFCAVCFAKPTTDTSSSVKQSASRSSSSKSITSSKKTTSSKKSTPDNSKKQKNKKAQKVNTNSNLKNKQVNIVFTGDMHSHVEPFTIENAVTNTEVGGFARIASIINDQKQRDPDTLVVDGGDFAMGTLYETLYESDAAELSLLSDMGYDAVTLGTHELDAGDGSLANMLTTAKNKNELVPQMVLSNLDYEASFGGLDSIDNSDMVAEKLNLLLLKSALDSYKVKDYTIINKNGFKIALFGIFGKDSFDCTSTTKLVFKDPITTAHETVKQIKRKENPDMIVCLSHSGTNADPEKSEDELLAQCVPDIDLIISGHSHAVLENPIVYGNTTIVASGEYGEKVGNITLTPDSNKRWNIKHHELIEVNSSIPEDKKILKKIKYYSQKINSNMTSSYGYTKDQVICTNTISNTSLEDMGTSLNEEPFLNLLSDAYIYAAQHNNIVDKNIVSIVPAVVVRSVLPKDKAVTVSDVFDIFPIISTEGDLYGSSLVCVYLYGSELKTLSDILTTLAQFNPIFKIGVGGLSYTYNPKRIPLNSIMDIKFFTNIGEEYPINDDQLYPVVTDLYTLNKMNLMENYTYGILTVDPKDKNGVVLEQTSDAILKNSSGKTVKAWDYVIKYIQSFNSGSIPYYYSTTQNRQIQDTSINPIAIFKNPNKISWIAYLIIAIVLLILLAIVLIIIKIIRKTVVKKRLKNQPASVPTDELPTVNDPSGNNTEEILTDPLLEDIPDESLEEMLNHGAESTEATPGEENHDDQQ